MIRNSPLRRALAELPDHDEQAASAVRDRAAQILRPAGALARLDELAIWLAGWQRTVQPRVARPAALIFAGDHGVAAAGVSAYPADVTAAMHKAFTMDRSTINAFARQVGASVAAHDVGIGQPTGDIRTESALSPERFDAIVELAFAAVDALDADVLVLGEMGIGNTTAAAAVAAAIAKGTGTEWVGRGTGVDDEGFARKRAAVDTAIARIADVTDPLEILREVGGSELVAMAAATVAARRRSLPVVVDGFVVTSALFPLEVAMPGALGHCTVGHCSAEPGHRRLLDRLGKEPLLTLDMRLGEGSGAMAAIPLLAMACVGVTEVPTFGEWFG